MAQKILNTGTTLLVDKPRNRVGSNWFDLSHDVKLSCNAGELIPIACIEVSPGDEFDIDTESIVRMAPMLAPVMHRMAVRSEWFFVPYRILWDGWERFISPQNYDSTPPALPYFQNINVEQGTLSDYLGLPLNPTGSTVPIDKVSALAHYAYLKICVDWYQNQDVIPQAPWTGATDGDNTVNYGALNGIANRNWDLDYFTSMKPRAQKGNPVVIPVAGGTGNIGLTYLGGTQGALIRRVQPGGGNLATGDIKVNGTGTSEYLRDSANNQITVDLNGNMAVDKTSLNANAGTINQLRAAEALQTWLENDLEGTRYIETIENHFDVYSSDGRLQRAEYLGNTYQPLVISEVLQTSEGTNDSPQGQMAGHGITASAHNLVGKKYCEEWGVIIGLSSILPVTGYSQGIPKMYSKFDRLDYMWPEFGNIGMTEVKTREVYYDSTNSTYNNSTMGYLPQYSEYRTMYNRLAGEFRTSLSYWTLSRLFSNLPTLGTLVICRPQETMRIFADENVADDHFYCHWYHKIKVKRKLVRYSVPTIA